MREEVEKKPWTDEEINDLAEWLKDLSIDQIFFLRESYESLLRLRAQEVGSKYVH